MESDNHIFMILLSNYRDQKNLLTLETFLMELEVLSSIVQMKISKLLLTAILFMEKEPIMSQWICFIPDSQIKIINPEIQYNNSFKMQLILISI
jgi:ATP adenylyltransferase/5',5'''-P-1,P-4-tetraphosphate phosphorylase II